MSTSINTPFPNLREGEVNDKIGHNRPSINESLERQIKEARDWYLSDEIKDRNLNEKKSMMYIKYPSVMEYWEILEDMWAKDMKGVLARECEHIKANLTMNETDIKYWHKRTMELYNDDTISKYTSNERSELVSKSTEMMWYFIDLTRLSIKEKTIGKIKSRVNFEDFIINGRLELVSDKL